MKKFAIILALGSALSPALLATANNCGTGGSGSPLFTNPTTSITAATANGNNGVTGFATGCETINTVFSTFTVGTTGDGADEPSSTAELAIRGTLQSGTITAPSVIRLLINPVDAADWTFDPDNMGNPDGTQTTTVTFRVDIDTSVLANARLYGILGGGFNFGNYDAADDIIITTQICSVVGGDGICNANGGDTLLNTHVMNLSSATNPALYGNASFGADIPRSYSLSDLPVR